MKKYSGLTLIELLIVTSILGLLIFISYVIINNGNSLTKARDVESRQDIQAIKSVIEAYYNDNNCYPLEVPFGYEWREQNTTYMSEVPQNPQCSSDSTKCYVYKNSGEACPQWYALFSPLETEVESSNTGINSAQNNCSLSQISSCVPSDFTTQWSCISGGNVDCSALSASQLSAGSTECLSSERRYSCTGTPVRCNVVGEGNGTFCSSTCGGVCN